MAKKLLAEGWAADLLVANNVLAHVPDLNDFVASLALLLKPGGVLSVEFPHLLQLIDNVQFDTIYHEHYCYFSLLTLQRIFARHGLEIFDVTELPTHGGSLRIYARGRQGDLTGTGPALEKVRRDERGARLDRLDGYRGFAEKIAGICRELRAFIDDAASRGKTVAAYGAAAKGNTLLNVCGITHRQIPYVAEKNPNKQGLWLPGSHIPVYGPAKVFTTRPDYLLILPWNLEDEISAEMHAIRGWGGRFLTAIPRLKEWG